MTGVSDNENDRNSKKGSSDYLIIVEDFDVELSYMNENAKNKDEANDSKKKRYSFMLILPKDVI